MAAQANPPASYAQSMSSALLGREWQILFAIGKLFAACRAEHVIPGIVHQRIGGRWSGLPLRNGSTTARALHIDVLASSPTQSNLVFLHG